MNSMQRKESDCAKFDHHIYMRQGAWRGQSDSYRTNQCVWQGHSFDADASALRMTLQQSTLSMPMHAHSG